MIKKFSLLIIVILTMSACSSSEGGEQVITDSFDRGAMLVNIADNMIIPAYEDFNDKMNSLKSAGDSFVANPNQTNLDSFRSAWLTAYKSWQYVEMFNIGKAEELQYSFYMNIYPLTVSDVEENIANGSYDLNSVNNHDAQGFPALDYLLYGVDDTDAKILEKYTTAANNDNYKKYITDVLNQMSTLTNTIVSDFKTQRDTFVVSTQNTATSVVNKLINDYIFYYEKGLRANKFGIPAGVFSNTTLPNKVEGFYKNDVSKELSLEALTAVKNLFEGTSYNGNSNGLSFKNYLIQLEREDIASAITTQLAAATSEINKLDNSFTVQVNSDNTAMTKSYDELQKVVVYFKVDMLQAFNINVDYVDADGD